MNTILALLKREFKVLGSSPILYIYLLFFMLYNGYSFYLILTILNQPITPPGSPMQLFFGQSVIYWLLILFLSALITMGTIADEKRLGTIELLLTAPVKEWEVIIAKFLASWFLYIILWIPTFIYVLILEKYGNPDWGPIITGYLGTFLMGALFISAGIFASSVTNHPIIAAIVSFVILCLLFFLGLFEYLPINPSFQKLVHYINWWSQMEDWSKGVIDTGHIIYYVSLGALFIFASIRVLELRVLRPLESIWFVLLLLFFPIALPLIIILKGRIGSEEVRYSKVINNSAQILLVFILVGMSNYLGMRHYSRFDWTKSKIFTLSDRTRAILKTLPREVEIYSFLSQDNELYPSIKQMFETYSSQGAKNLKIIYVDPDLDQTVYREALEKFKVAHGKTEDGREVSDQVIIVSAGDKRKFVVPDEMTQIQEGPEYQMGAQAYIFHPTKAETAITSAIYGVIENKTHKVCFTSGHGEWDINNYSPESRGIGFLRDPFQNLSFEMEDINIRNSRSIPAECELVVVAGPSMTFLESEAQLLKRYTEEGGDIIFLLDPIIEGQQFLATGLENIIKSWGIALHQDEVFEQDEDRVGAFCGGGHPNSFIAGSSESEHPISLMLRPYPNTSIPVCFERVRSMEKVGGVTPEPEKLLETSNKSFGETNPAEFDNLQPQENDPRGPLTIAAAVELKNIDAHTQKVRQENNETKVREQQDEQQSRGSRIVVVGDSDFLDQRLLNSQALGNIALLEGIFGWVMSRQALVSIPPKEIEQVKLTLTDSQMRNIMLILFVFIPVGIILLGVGMWWTRRKT